MQTVESSQEPSKRPILVTGSHRCGSTWVGRMLATSPEVHYVHEPFAPMYERSWVEHPPRERFLYQPEDEPGPYAQDLQRIVALSPPWSAIAQRAGGLRNRSRLLEEYVRTTVARRRGARALVKDPFCLMMCEWFANQCGAQVVLLLRHPAAFAGSVKRLSWRLDVRWLLGQPGLMEKELEPFRDGLELDARGQHDVIDHAILLWSIMSTVSYRYQGDHPDWNVVRYEDLAVDPQDGFKRLYASLAITWSNKTERLVKRHNAATHGTEVASGQPGGTQRDSKNAMWTWTNRLTAEEIRRIRVGTEGLADRWYGERDWTPSST